jgi:hypothetical protein
MRRAGRRLGIPITLLVLLLGAVGCGGDDEETSSMPSISISVPSISVPAGAESVPSGSATTTTGATTTGKGSTAKPDPAKTDSPANDLPPPPGSPQEAFERQCKQNPAACG